MITGHTNFLQSLGWAVFSSLWQMALLWIGYQAIVVLAKPAKASFKSSLASFLLITGFAWFIYTFVFIFSSGTEDAVKLPVLSSLTGADEEKTNWLQTILSSASVLYLVLLCLPLLRFIRNYRYVQIIRRYGLKKMDVQWRIFVQKVAERMDIRKHVQLWATEFVSSPVTIGFLKPVILVPLAAINHLTLQQLEAVLLHELSHIRRHDYLLNLIINVIRSILYFNPFVKAFVKIVEKEREKSCDEMVLQFQYDSYEYASALLILEKTNQINKSLAVAASGKSNDLLHRIELIVGIRKKPVLSFNKLAAVLASLLCIFSMNALLVVHKPLTGARAALLSSLSFAHLSPDNNIKQESTVAANYSMPELSNMQKQPVSPEAVIAHIDIPELVNVKFDAVDAVQLKKYQEDQVRQAIEKSKKVFKNEEWKALERNVAEVLTQKEKDELKATYDRELSKLDWNKWENKLRQAYDNVDWGRVNEQLAKAVNNIRIDSLQRVYNDAICKLDKANEELVSSQLKGIPDSGITTTILEETKQQLKKTLTHLRAARNKKIVHL